MGSRYGAFLDGLNVIHRPRPGGRNIFEEFIANMAFKGHAGYAGSDLKYISNVLTTTDTTVTKCIEIPVASGDSIHGIALIGGKQNDQSDASHALFVFSATNAAGTTAVKGTSTITIVESDAATNFTIAADDTNDDIELRVTGPAETWLWAGHCFYFNIRTAA